MSFDYSCRSKSDKRLGRKFIDTASFAAHHTSITDHPSVTSCGHYTGGFLWRRNVFPSSTIITDFDAINGLAVDNECMPNTQAFVVYRQTVDQVESR